MPSGRRRISWLAVLAIAGGCWATPRYTPPARPVTLALDIEQTVLPNGMGVVVVAEPSAREVSVTVRYAVGSNDDPPGQAGLAHLVEHVLFEPVRAGEAVFPFLERTALGFEAFTASDETAYIDRGTPDQLEELLEAETARVEIPCSQIPGGAFARQHAIVRNEILERASEEHVRAALGTAIYGADAPAGALESVARLTHADVCAFAAAHYTPRNAVLVISGATTLAAARPLVDRTLGRLPRGPAPVARGPTPPRVLAHRSRVAAPVDRPWVAYAWPMPDDPVARARIEAVAAMVEPRLDARINGEGTILELGTAANRWLAIAYTPAPGIAAADVDAAIAEVLRNSSQAFASGLYEHARNRRVYDLARSLEHEGTRDVRLAAEVAAGHDVRATIAAVFHELSTLDRERARGVLQRALDPEAATIRRFEPTPHASQAAPSPAIVVTDGRPATSADANATDDAHHPLAVPDAANTARSSAIDAADQILLLENGLRVVLAPRPALPILDVRLIVPAGQVDEPIDRPGIARIAAAAEPVGDSADLQVVQLGTDLSTFVTFDHTELRATGLAAHPEATIGFLARQALDAVVDGTTVGARARSPSLPPSAADRTADAAWRIAIYGDHPHRADAAWHRTQRTDRDVAAVREFRHSHYVPEGSTLIIAGQFEPTEVMRIVHASFDPWTGTVARRAIAPAALDPLAFAQTHDDAQVEVLLAFAQPSPAALQSQVIAQMLEDAIADVRESLAASYGIHAQLVEHRFSSLLVLGGAVEVSRATEAVALLRDRLSALRDASPATAARFVIARRKIAARLATLPSTVDSAATAIEHRVDLELDPLPDAGDVAAVASLTLETVMPRLQALSLSQAAILIRGPRAAVAQAYAVLGRTPAWLE